MKKKNKMIPYYSGKKGKWCVKLVMGYQGKDILQTEEGELDYVVCEYLRTSLYYPFWLDENRDTERDFQPHAHSFNDALSWLLHYPEHFSIEGFEEFYSEQEIELIQNFQKKLLEDLGKNK